MPFTIFRCYIIEVSIGVEEIFLSWRHCCVRCIFFEMTKQSIDG